MKRLIPILLSLLWVPPALALDLVANRTMPAGTIIASGDLTVLGQVPKDAAEAYVGMEIRRAVYAGRPVSETDLGPATLIRRNDIVTMLYRSGALGLRTEGRALSPGGKGERIEVMNLDSRLTVRATVTARGHVEVIR